MMRLFQVLREGASQVSPEEIMAGLMIGLVLGLTCYGLGMLIRGRTTNPLPLLSGLIIVVSALSMVIGAGYWRLKSVGFSDQIRVTDRYPGSSPGGFPGPQGPGRPRDHPRNPPRIGGILLRQADLDGNGQLSPEEAARFVKNADHDGKGWVDARDIDRAVSASMGLPVAGNPPPISAPIREGRGGF